jgi:hypothetical protein
MHVFYLFSFNLLKLLGLISFCCSVRNSSRSSSIALLRSSRLWLNLASRAEEDISWSVVMNNLLNHLSAIVRSSKWLLSLTKISCAAIHWLDRNCVVSGDLLLSWLVVIIHLRVVCISTTGEDRTSIGTWLKDVIILLSIFTPYMKTN